MLHPDQNFLISDPQHSPKKIVSSATLLQNGNASHKYFTRYGTCCKLNYTELITRLTKVSSSDIVKLSDQPGTDGQVDPHQQPVT